MKKLMVVLSLSLLVVVMSCEKNPMNSDESMTSITSFNNENKTLSVEDILTQEGYWLRVSIQDPAEADEYLSFSTDGNGDKNRIVFYESKMLSEVQLLYSWSIVNENNKNYLQLNYWRYISSELEYNVNVFRKYEIRINENQFYIILKNGERAIYDYVGEVDF